ncbi:hypothetical protein XI08_18905 [Bradyrhizobium sp. CCBAU 11361]|nr:hypothetical protein [Bradyrhizobium sp. CCBAU 11361]MDA9491099.1 hypothetical protein [Bradyrhizobium sp. CCBAU 11361]
MERGALLIGLDIHQYLAGDDFGVSKMEIMQTRLNELHDLFVRFIGAFAILEYHHCDTDAFTSVQDIVRLESMRFP